MAGITSLYHDQIPLQTTLTMLGLFGMGSFFMRSAGCIINDIWDHKYDKNVERTKTRPLASGELSVLSALGLLSVNLSTSLYILMQLNLPTQILGCCALLPLFVYPATKRFSNFPQFYLGLCFNWGLLMGWSQLLPTAADPNIISFLPALALYLSCISWTMYYDTIYANQDKLDDLKLGLKSTAITLQKRPKLWLLLFSTITSSNLCLFGYLTNQENIYYGFMGLVYAYFLKQIMFINLNSSESCGRHFKANSNIGLMVTLGLLTSLYIKVA
jgi:4-hydroxybenzoate polyprenyltransferase